MRVALRRTMVRLLVILVLGWVVASRAVAQDTNGGQVSDEQILRAIVRGHALRYHEALSPNVAPMPADDAAALASLLMETIHRDRGNSTWWCW